MVLSIHSYVTDACKPSDQDLMFDMAHVLGLGMNTTDLSFDLMCKTLT